MSGSGGGAGATEKTGREPPRWIGKLDNVTTAKAVGLAALFVVKPKNLLLTIGAGIAVAQLGVSPAAQAVGVAVFVALGTVGLAVPLAIHMLMLPRGRGLLTGLRNWMVSENPTTIAVLSVVIAAKLLGDALISRRAEPTTSQARCSAPATPPEPSGQQNLVCADLEVVLWAAAGP